MKKNLLGWLAMAAMLVGTGCSTDEVVNDFSQGNAIQFGTYVGRDAQARATVINNEKLGTEGFGVFAYYTKGVQFNETATPNFMYNQKVEKLSNEWTYSPEKYWPNNDNDYVSFFAYAPYTAQPTETTDNGDSDYNIGRHYANTSKALPSLTFYVHPTVKEQQDLLWATPVLDKTRKNVNDVDDKVLFNFHHALSRIGFSVQAMIDKANKDTNGTKDDATDSSESFETDNDNKQITTVSVQSIELSGAFYNAGTLSYSKDDSNIYTAAFTGTTTPENGIAYVLSGIGNDGNFEEVANNVTTIDTKLNKDDSYIMVIPKDFSDSGSKLTLKIVYTVSTTDTNLANGKSEIVNTITKNFNIESGFEAGKAYNFSLHLGLTSVKFEAEVDEWIPASSTETDYAVNLPLNIEDNDTPSGGSTSDGGTGSGDSNN